jgi:hypothetical protein
MRDECDGANWDVVISIGLNNSAYHDSTDQQILRMVNWK